MTEDGRGAPDTSAGPRGSGTYVVSVTWKMSGWYEVGAESADDAEGKVIRLVYGDDWEVSWDDWSGPPPSDRTTIAPSLEIGAVFRAIELPPHLEELWHEMQELKRHPRFGEACYRLDPRSRDAWWRLMFIPRRWLLDGRENQVREAMGAIRAVMDQFPCWTTGEPCSAQQAGAPAAGDDGGSE